jgi:sialate O-acetylesterase
MLSPKVSFLRIPAFALSVAFWILTGPLNADVMLAPLFQNGAVLQRDRAIPVWGRAEPGEPVRVTFHGESVETQAGSDGRWRVMLRAQPASAEGAELVVQGRDTVRVRDVLVGDVWLCGGQSNMAFTVYRGLNANAEIGVANFPLIRHFLVPRRVAEQPAADAPGAWQICHPESVADFSGVGYFFARDLHLRNGVPVGLVNATWGGTQIESWMSAAAVRQDPASEMIQRRWEARLADYPKKHIEADRRRADWQARADAATAQGQVFDEPVPPAAEGPMSRWMPSGLYNAMIAPLVPMPFRGVIWYQGEANAPRAAEYASLFQGLIRQWRGDFGPNLPFYFVQLANHDRASDKTKLTWAYLREAQEEALALPDTGMVVTIDIGDVQDVHPKNKQAVGRRLALIARRQLEGEPVNFSGPIFKSAQREGNAMRVTFEHGGGLNSRGAPIVGVEVAGPDRKFVPAIARIEGDTLVASAEAVPAPEAVRYAWHNFPEACLFDGDGLPAAPFRSKRWD